MKYYFTVEMPRPDFIDEDDNARQLKKNAFITGDGKWMVTFGRLQFQINQLFQAFTFGLWVKINIKEIERIAAENGNFSCSGTLLSDIPFYGEGLGSDIEISFDSNRSNFYEPSLSITSVLEKPYLHQRYGIPLEIFQEWMGGLHSGKSPMID
jgi:hypothetical protein